MSGGTIGVNMFALGQKGTSSEVPKYLGTKVEFDNLNYTSATLSTDLTLQSGAKIQAIWVQNDSGGAYNRREIVKWKAGSEGTKTDAVTGSAEIGAGVVDHTLTTTVANGECYWLIVYGPTEGRSAGSVSAGARIIPAATGEFTTVTSDAAGAMAFCGRCMVAATGADQARAIFVDFRI